MGGGGGGGGGGVERILGGSHGFQENRGEGEGVSPN